MKAWHFTGDKLRDGTPIPPVGEVLVYEGNLVMCQSGLHASKRILDALRYAPGHMIHRVECGGTIKHQDDKLVCTERTILWTVDGVELLREFARRCALDVIHLWDAPKVVVKYLKTGDKSIRAAARDAACTAAWDAARAAEWAAEWDAACAAACAAAWDAARAAAKDVVWDAARDAQNKRLTGMVTAAPRLQR